MCSRGSATTIYAAGHRTAWTFAAAVANRFSGRMAASGLAQGSGPRVDVPVQGSGPQVDVLVRASVPQAGTRVRGSDPPVAVVAMRLEMFNEAT